MKKILYSAISILIWLVIWYLCALFINKPIFLPGPVDTVNAFFLLMKSADFYYSIGTSLFAITIGYLLGTLIGVFLSIIASINSFLETFINCPIKVIKAVPVVSFIILALLWIDSFGIPTLISALMVIPIIYTSLLSAIKMTDNKQKEMAKVFRLSPFKKLIYVYIPSTSQALLSSATIAAGYAWKAGVAAEVIGLIRNSIGNKIYQSKIYLETADMFAWTIALVILSILFEKIVALILVSINRLIGGCFHDKT